MFMNLQIPVNTLTIKLYHGVRRQKGQLFVHWNPNLIKFVYQTFIKSHARFEQIWIKTLIPSKAKSGFSRKHFISIQNQIFLQNYK